MEKTRSDLFCAFQPKRVTVPSLPLRFGRPPIPSACFAAASAARFARIVASGISSMSPDPKSGVGIRNATFGLPPPPVSPSPGGPKSGCGRSAVVHPGASTRPAIVNRS